MLWRFWEVSLRLSAATLLPSPRRIIHPMHPFSIKTLVSLWFWRGYDLPNTNYCVSCNTWVHMTGAPFPTLTRLAAAWTESPAGNMGLLIILQLLIGGTGWDHSLLSDVLISLTAVFPMGQLYFRCTSNVQYLTTEDMGRKNEGSFYTPIFRT